MFAIPILARRRLRNLASLESGSSYAAPKFVPVLGYRGNPWTAITMVRESGLPSSPALEIATALPASASNGGGDALLQRPEAKSGPNRRVDHAPD